MGPIDFVEARRRMVDGQLRPNRVTDPALLNVLGTLPRERFVPTRHQARAYADEEVPLASGRSLGSPMAVARLVQLLAPWAGQRALVAGASTGYGAAILARLGLTVVAIEDDAGLLELARAALGGLDLTTAVELVDGDPARGWPAAAPYDVILIEGEVPALPPELVAQLAPGGRMAGVVGDGARVGRATLGQSLGGTFTALPSFDLAMPALPAFAPVEGFVF